jgi:Putative transmembrane protein (PGPGW)
VVTVVWVSEHEYLGSRPGPDRDDIPDLIRKLRERKVRHKQRHIAHRAGVVLLGCLLVLAGVVMSGPGVPGPGIATILFGLFLLALEFERAERLLERAIVWGERAAARADRTTTAQRVVGAILGIIAVGAFIVAAILWNIPLLPVL